MTLRVEDIIRAVESVKRPAFDTALLPPDWAKGHQQEPLSLFGMRVIESPHAYKETREAKRLKSAWHPNHGHHYVLEYEVKREPVAFLINTDALRASFERYMPPIRLRDLATFDPTNVARIAW